MSIEFHNVSFIYERGLPWEKEALKDISLVLSAGEAVGIIGPTGSGKTTLLQLMNGILLPSAGEVTVEGENTRELKGRRLTRLRQQVGLVFQFPEDQVFERRVFDDIAFGPRNLGLLEEEVEARVRWAMELMQLDFDALHNRAPQTLSGGQKRRVAIAGVLAMRPKYLVMDEPAAGMDPNGRKHLLALIGELKHARGMGLILVSHRIQDVFAVCDRVVVLVEGKIAALGSPADLLRQEDFARFGLSLPPLNQIMVQLRTCFPDIRTDVNDYEAAAGEIARVLGR